MYKQWLCLLLILTLFITLVACDSKEEVDPSVESVIPSSEAVEEKTSIPVIQMNCCSFSLSFLPTGISTAAPSLPS